MDNQNINHLTDVFKALSDETRLRIIILLAGGELCVCQLSGILAIPQPKISKHLAKLRDMNFVTDRRQDKYIFYRLANNTPLLEIAGDIQKNIAQFPQLAVDQSRLSKKEKILSQCKGSPLLRR